MFAQKILTPIIFLISITQASYANSFTIYDGTQYINRPDMEDHGIKPITIIYESRFWNKNKKRNNLPNDEQIINLAKQYDGKTELIVLDIEHWKVQGHPYKPWIINDSIRKYIYTYNVFKANTLKSQVGYFGAILPVSNYKASIAETNTNRYRTWVNDNKKMNRLADIVDVAFPSVYTYSENINEWERSFITKIKELKSIYQGKIYVFLWPQYFDHAPASEEIRLKFIPYSFWKHQLIFASKRVDGVIIWGGWDFKKGRRMMWDRSAPWWKATLEFINESGN